MTDNEKKLLRGKAAVNMIYSVLNNADALEISEDFDWESFRSFTKDHNISNIIYYAVRTMSGVPDEILKFYEETYLRACLKTALTDVEIPALLDSFEENGVRHMPLKGYIMRNYYPDPAMRSMGCDFAFSHRHAFTMLAPSGIR